MSISVIRTAFLYGLLILAVRLMGKRQVAEMEPAEFVVTMLLANLASVPMQDNGLPLFSGVAPILTVLGLELILAVLSMKLLPVRRLLNGVPTLLIRNGKIDQKALTVSRVSLDELQQKLREKDVFDHTQVAYAILETDGELTVMLSPKFQNATAKDVGVKHPPAGLFYNVISDGVILPENLRLAGFNKSWLRKELRGRKCGRKEVFLLAVNSLGDIQFVKREKR
ncbi:MAG: DUF421 domain-containing protein [Oscillospiraceae bacterium]|nr:DUF421 domain-containing protein [Oscillospiraceae bacterium]